MKRFVALVLVVIFAGASVSFAQDCKNGRCQIVQVPKAVVSQSVEVAKGVAAAPVKAVKQVKVKKPVRHFLRKVFAR